MASENEYEISLAHALDFPCFAGLARERRGRVWIERFPAGIPASRHAPDISGLFFAALLRIEVLAWRMGNRTQNETGPLGAAGQLG